MSNTASSGTAATKYSATIRRTTHGVAHIAADSFADAAFGQGYACAADHLPIICDQIVKASAQRSKYFGTGALGENLHSDLGYAALGTRAQGEHMAATQPADLVAIVEGYAAGINQWWADHGRDGLPAHYRDAEWIGPVTAVDLFTMYADMALMASGRNLAGWIGSAHAPGEPTPMEVLAGDGVGPSGKARPGEPGFAAPFASNGWAMGKAATAHGGGLVMANPHFPWNGDGRFWECHLQVPGDVDIYGVSLIGVPGVQIGFNQGVAWTHTFSRGNRFVLYRLELGDSPTEYRYGDERRQLERREVQIEVLDDHGQLATHTFDQWHSHYGPMVDVPLLGWSPTDGYSMRDANAGNDRMLSQFLAMNRAQSIDELRAAIHGHQGLPWVNVMAADSAGNAWYTDASTTPKLAPEADAAFETAVKTDMITALFFSQRAAMLNGSDPANEWIDDPDAAAPGLCATKNLPELLTDDVVFNSNDPYWIPSPTQRIARGPVFAGIPGLPLNTRTRTNAMTLSNAPDGGWTADTAIDALFTNRAYVAELIVPELLARIGPDGANPAAVVTVDGSELDLGPALSVLAGWDLAFNLDSVGATLFRELLGSMSDDDLAGHGQLWVDPYDPADPIATPNTLTADDALLCTWLGRAVRALDSAGVPIDAPLGEVQWAQRGEHRIPVHGGNDVEGPLNIVTPVAIMTSSSRLTVAKAPDPIPGRTERTGLATGGYQCVYGASFVMAVEMGPNGPTAQGLLTYGQSGDVDSPHHIDQMQAFADKALRPIAYRDDDIAADPNLTVTEVASS